MKKRAGLLFLLIVLSSCNSVKIKNNSYKTSDSTIELLSIGRGTSSVNLKNNFQAIGFPEIQEKIKLSVEIVPHNKATSRVYTSKKEFNQDLKPLAYADSLDIKPELVLIEIADKTTLLEELNTDYNKSLSTLIQKTKKTSIVLGIMVHLENEQIEKIKRSENYYLVQTDLAKFEIALYSGNKKTESIYIAPQNIIGYKTRRFCWMENDRGKWIIGDFSSKNNSCDGDTYSKVKPKKEKSLYKM